ncbi:hypothetical protein TELCIR_09931 [Teladorsagia circumcincta]|uniref:Uncharacterized protein n=1 Tax=Teladorsagia circumcincta TaxID=45464 RepID=A0A2G9UDG2_TELCI|nr:hypothetical protein TELCIR_09931 [Teladorsagia circumcincta]
MANLQVRAKVDGEWNHWRSAPRKVITGETAEIRRSCCIVPPPYMVENIGSPGSWWEVDVSPAATENGVTRYRTRKEHRRMVTNGQHVPLLEEDKTGMEANLRSLESRLDKMRGAVVDGRSRGDFEDGYMKGYKDANKLGSASAARRRMDDDYGTKDDRFHEGYVKGLKDAGMTGMSTSMHNLAQRGPGGGYSTGFMQGYKDGNSGIFGDRVTPSLISRLDEQYPGQDDFKQGYVDGFKEGAGSRTGERRTFEDSRRLQQSLTELTERLTSLEKTKGDEIHSTKIYHVYVGSPRRYASQTLLDGSRPGPSTPHARRDALSTLQRELDTLSRSPDRSTPRGYTSDTGNAYDTVRSKARGYSNYDYDPADDAGRWADDLLEIVSEPMNKTLDRMKKYSTSSANVGEYDVKFSRHLKG